MIFLMLSIRGLEAFIFYPNGETSIQTPGPPEEC